MAINETDTVDTKPRAVDLNGVLVALYSATLLLSAGLLFWLQPFVGKLLLPLLGGAPAVWNAAMLFFQAGLLAGYLYAHASSVWLRPNAQALLHLVLLSLCMAWLPIGISGTATTGLLGAHPAAGSDPVWWLLGTLGLGIGFPFAMLSASAPILQRWFAASGHVDAGNPYFLYAASNVGSMAALLGFPLVAEPLLDLSEQSITWSGGFIALILLVGASAFAARGFALQPSSQSQETPAPPSWGRRLHWVVLVFATTSLMLGLTTYITTDVAAAPLLWVVPLLLYLLTFVLAFARRQRVGEAFVRRLLIGALVPFVPLWLVGGIIVAWPVWAFFLALLFLIIALGCHMILARLRPHSAWLTEFYLWMAIGGVLGGVFNAFAAPLLFDTVAEFPLMLTLGVALVLAVPDRQNPRASMVFAAFVIIGLGGTLAYTSTALLRTPNVLLSERNFFGALRVTSDPDMGANKLIYGSTIHGIQATDPAFATEPLSYYGRVGPVGDVFAALDARVPTDSYVGVVGLGIGTVACYQAPGRQFTFFEINPAVIEIAKDTALFSFLSNCPNYSVHEGDGRLLLAAQPKGKFDVLLVDAFSGDSIPVHLLTREAFALYMERLAPGGSLAVHISNRYMNLAPVVGAIARDLGLAAVHRVGENTTVPGTQLPSHRAQVVVLARDRADLAVLVARPGWEALTQASGLRAWTDDYSNILAALQFKWSALQEPH